MVVAAAWVSAMLWTGGGGGSGSGGSSFSLGDRQSHHRPQL